MQNPTTKSAEPQHGIARVPRGTDLPSSLAEPIVAKLTLNFKDFDRKIHRIRWAGITRRRVQRQYNDTQESRQDTFYQSKSSLPMLRESGEDIE